MKRVSKPGRRVYKGKEDIKRFKNGYLDKAEGGEIGYNGLGEFLGHEVEFAFPIEDLVQSRLGHYDSNKHRDAGTDYTYVTEIVVEKNQTSVTKS
jgi:hypothetical protein